MAVPKKIFIDTCVLDACSYNFESAVIQPIVDVAKNKDNEWEATYRKENSEVHWDSW